MNAKQSSTTQSTSANIDPAEIEKFQAIASRWWDSESEFRPLHEINPLRADYIEKKATGLTDKKIVDIGCGGGILTEALARKGAQVTGIDVADLSLKVAKMHLHESKLDIDYRMTTAEDFAIERTGEFDIVTCLEMLEHVPDPASIIAAASTLLKPGGLLFLSTLNRNPKSFVLAIIGAEYILNMLPKGTHDYNKFIKPSELARAVRASSMDVEEVIGMTYNPLTKRYKLGTNVDVNYLMYCSKP